MILLDARSSLQQIDFFPHFLGQSYPRHSRPHLQQGLKSLGIIHNIFGIMVGIRIAIMITIIVIIIICPCLKL